MPPSSAAIRELGNPATVWDTPLIPDGVNLLARLKGVPLSWARAISSARCLMAARRRDGRRNESAGPTAEGLVALAFSPYRGVVVLSRAGQKIQKLLELPPIPAPLAASF
jgi:hypothetical protein